jgi:N-acetylmuramoyl-L-alanine amidase
MNEGNWSFETAARTLWQEARGECDEGRAAVAHVLWNRLRTHRWGTTLASVCLSPLQFSGWNAHDPNRMAAAELADRDPVLGECRAILAAAKQLPDPTGGALYYHALSIPPPPWSKTMIPAGRFGRQRFYRDR